MTDETKPHRDAGPPKQAGPADDTVSAQTPAEVKRRGDAAASGTDETSTGTAEASATPSVDSSDATVEIPASELLPRAEAADPGSAGHADVGDATVELPASSLAAAQGGAAADRMSGQEPDAEGADGSEASTPAEGSIAAEGSMAPAATADAVGAAEPSTVAAASTVADASAVADEPRTAGDAPDPATIDGTPSAAGSPWRRFVGAVFTTRLTAANAIIALLVGLLGFALITQVRSNSNESTLANDRPDDLVRILSDLDARKDRLGTEISSLQSTVQQLNSGAQGRQAALDAAARRADELGILGGTLAAQGPGLIVELVPAAKQQVPANTVLDTVEELRGAGAEAMEISGTGSSAVRIVASTYFTDVSGGVNVDGTAMGGTLSITVIGDPQTMQAALSIAGGVVDTVHNDGGTVDIQTPGSVEVTALHQSGPLRYAKPAS